MYEMKPQQAPALVIKNATFITSAATASQFITPDKPMIAVCGKSNVGKSSLINTLLGRKSLARVSSAPGKTITINYYDVDKKLYLVDLPGYGYAKRPKDQKKVWSNLTESYFLKKAEDMVYAFSDSKTPQNYWLAKSFILLGDIYLSRDDAFQARATYQSVVDGYSPSDDGIVDEAKAKIAKMN